MFRHAIRNLQSQRGTQRFRHEEVWPHVAFPVQMRYLIRRMSPATNMAVTTPATGFKDWAIVVSALLQGRQSIILRKGGIAEGRDGFRFKHENFFLFPTQYHQQMEKVRSEELAHLSSPPIAPAGSVEIRAFFQMDWAIWLDEWSTIAGLAAFHIYRHEVLRERFDYGDERGLQCAFGRVFRVDPTWQFPDKPSYGGCRSWLSFPELPTGTLLHPVLGDAEHQDISLRVRGALGHVADTFAI